MTHAQGAHKIPRTPYLLILVSETFFCTCGRANYFAVAGGFIGVRRRVPQGRRHAGFKAPAARHVTGRGVPPPTPPTLPRSRRRLDKLCVHALNRIKIISCARRENVAARGLD